MAWLSVQSFTLSLLSKGGKVIQSLSSYSSITFIWCFVMSPPEAGVHAGVWAWDSNFHCSNSSFCYFMAVANCHSWSYRRWLNSVFCCSRTAVSQYSHSSAWAACCWNRALTQKGICWFWLSIIIWLVYLLLNICYSSPMTLQSNVVPIQCCSNPVMLAQYLMVIRALQWLFQWFDPVSSRW
jgi:hypothetical protein